MALNSSLLEALKAKTGKSDSTLSRWARELNQAHGPMTGNEARWVIAHDLGIDLREHLSGDQMERVAVLRARGARWPLKAAEREPSSRTPERQAPTEPPTRSETPRSAFDARGLHHRVVSGSRSLFLGGHRTEAVRKAFQSVNNRVRKLAGTRKDDAGVMFAAFGGDDPPLAVNPRSTVSEVDEQEGATHLFAGSVLSQRNPRSHEDDWEPDHDPAYSLDCLALASLLHRILDRIDPD